MREDGNGSRDLNLLNEHHSLCLTGPIIIIGIIIITIINIIISVSVIVIIIIF